VCGAGPNWAVAGARKGKRKRPAGLEWMRAERRKGEREGKGFVFFFNFLFQIHFSNIQTKSMHSKHDAQALINSKLF
jgi:hypothetical protein